MARAARHVGRKASVAGLLAATACAVMQQPPGAPPDFDVPIILSITPDSGSIADSLEDHLVFQFDEVISEASGGGIEKLIIVSPRASEVDVDWRRSALGVRPKGGWVPGIVYHVTLLPGITDLQNNRLDSSRTVIFSTGGPIPDTRVDGTVLNWENGRSGAGALIEAMLLPDSLVYTASADSTGRFLLTALPIGTYVLSGIIDGNRNLRRERREPFDSVTVRLDSAVTHILWAFVHDTVGSRLRQATHVDSMTVRLQFTQKVEPGAPPLDAITVWALPDTIAVATAEVLTQLAYDSLRAAAAADSAAADSLAADSAVADTGAAADTATAPDTTVLTDPAAAGDPARGIQQPVSPQAIRLDIEAGPAAQDSTAQPAVVLALLAERPPLSDILYIRMQVPLTPGNSYLIEANLRNVLGAAAESQTVLLAPAPQPRDST